MTPTERRLRAALDAEVWKSSGVAIAPADLAALLDELDRARAVVSAAKWLTDIWADNVTITEGTSLWEDLQRLRAAIAAYDRAVSKP